MPLLLLGENLPALVVAFLGGLRFHESLSLAGVLALAVVHCGGLAGPLALAVVESGALDDVGLGFVLGHRRDSAGEHHRGDGGRDRDSLADWLHPRPPMIDVHCMTGPGRRAPTRYGRCQHSASHREYCAFPRNRLRWTPAREAGNPGISRRPSGLPS